MNETKTLECIFIIDAFYWVSGKQKKLWLLLNLKLEKGGGFSQKTNFVREEDEILCRFCNITSMNGHSFS